jgi:hypothetical protein
LLNPAIVVKVCTSTAFPDVHMTGCAACVYPNTGPAQVFQ